MPEGLRPLLVTRPQPQADEWVSRLNDLGVPAQALPLLCIEPLPSDDGELVSAWQRLAGQDLVMFVSPNAVLRFWASSAARSWPASVRAAATGSGTAGALLQCGVPPEAIDQPLGTSDRFDAETLWAQVLGARDWAGRRVLIVRGEDGRDWLAETLRQAGAEVEFLAAYRRCAPPWSDGERERLATVLGNPHAVWLFSSSQCIDHLMDALQERGAAALDAARHQVALATHPKIADTAWRAGWRDVRAVLPDAGVIREAWRGLSAAAR